MSIFKTSFKKQKIKNTTIKYKKLKIFFKWFLYIFFTCLLISITWFIYIYFTFLYNLPSVSQLDDLDISETSVIYDRNWKELYKIFKEKRTYIDYESISENMINAIVATEDKRYWTNPWIDIKWLLRAWINYTLWKTEKVKWTSTLTQQLIRNTIITNEKSIERKIKEIYLSLQLSTKMSKEKILELYLNKIWYWHNSYWIEEASKTFFWIKASDLNILQSSILASLPKWPTFYSPYNHFDRTVWYPYIYTWNNDDDFTKLIKTKDIILNNEIINKLKSTIKNLKIWRIKWTNTILICNLKNSDLKNELEVDSDWCSIIKYSKLIYLLNSFKLKFDENFIEYQTWRKDYVLTRMFEDWYINSEEYKNSIISAIWYKFKQKRENIKAPHFVFYVKEYLEQQFWEKIANIWWLKIYTTLNLDLQNQAEELISKQTKININKINANNAALVTLDNINWEIVTMVWWNDYFDTENHWNVNIITSKLQPWSTFKPFVYSLWIKNSPIGSKTPIYDLETEFAWEYTPWNFDWEFLWKMDLTSALNHSRNIPATKMFFMAWWERNIINFMTTLWVQSFKKIIYWAPLALWTWEITPLELANAYNIFANNWKKIETWPILKIIDSKWNEIFNKEQIKVNKVQIMDEAQAYIINSMLSETTSRPAWWNSFLSLKDRLVAAKTWTSTKQTNKDWEKIIRPANLWTIWYTPQYTTVVWVWNTNWEQLKEEWNWLEYAWPIWHDFMEILHKNKEILQWEKSKKVLELNISKHSWYLANFESSNNISLVESLFVNKPDKYDETVKILKVDKLCNWIINENTPKEAIINAKLLNFISIDPLDEKWQEPIDKWSNITENINQFLTWSENYITSLPTKECIRFWNNNIIIKSNIIDNQELNIWKNNIMLAYKSKTPIKKIELLINWIILKEININNKYSWSFVWDFFIPISKISDNAILEIKVIDSEYFSKIISNPVIITKK
jgi:penicillin-binding protein 1A